MGQGSSGWTKLEAPNYIDTFNTYTACIRAVLHPPVWHNLDSAGKTASVRDCLHHVGLWGCMSLFGGCLNCLMDSGRPTLNVDSIFDSRPALVIDNGELSSTVQVVSLLTKWASTFYICMLSNFAVLFQDYFVFLLNFYLNFRAILSNSAKNLDRITQISQPEDNFYWILTSWT